VASTDIGRSGRVRVPVQAMVAGDGDERVVAVLTERREKSCIRTVGVFGVMRTY
jgi:hypothetical protein